MKRAKSGSPAKTYKSLQALAWIALICTIVLTLILLAEGLTPGDESSAQSDFVSGIVNKILKRENEVPVKRIAFRTDFYTKEYYNGDAVTLDIEFYPDDATNKEVSFSVDDPSVATINEDGELVFLSEGVVTVTATANNVHAQKTYDCYGEKYEFDESKLEFIFEPELTVGQYSAMTVKYAGEVVSNNRIRIPETQAYFPGNSLKPYKSEVDITVYAQGGQELTKTVHVAGSVTPPQSITLNRSTILLGVGDSLVLQYSVSPEGAPNDVVAEIEDEEIIRYNGTLMQAKAVGRTQIKVKSAYSDDVYQMAEVIVYEHGSEELGTPNTMYLSGSPEVKVGKIGYINIVVDGYRVLNENSCTIEVEGDSVVARGLSYLGVKEGESVVSLTAYGVTKSVTVTATGEVPELGDIRVPSFVNVYEGDSRWLTPAYTIKKISSLEEYSFTSSDPSVATVSRNGEIVGVQNGVCVVSVTSAYDKTITKDIEVTVFGGTPTELNIVGDERIAYNATAQYAVQYERAFYGDEITWEVVEGPGVINEYGQLTCNGLGDIKIQARSSLNSELVAEKTIYGVIYKSFKLFVRKFIGHFSAFALLGVGVLTCCLLMLNKKGWSALIAPASTFAVAGLSEIFQLPIFTSGRYASFIDVLIDFTGSLIGMVVVLIVVALIMIVSAIRQGDFRAEFKSFNASCMVKSRKISDAPKTPKRSYRR